HDPGPTAARGRRQRRLSGHHRKTPFFVSALAATRAPPAATASSHGARDEPIVLAGRPHAHPAVGFPLFRPQLHGLVPAGPDAGADRRSPVAGHPATRADGG